MLFARRSCRLKTGTGQLTPGLTHQFRFFFFFFLSSSCEVGYPQPWLLKEANLYNTVFFSPGFQLATGKNGRFLYDLARAGSQD